MIYFLRHGESEANVAHVFAGQKDDSPLTVLGREQALQACEYLKNKGISTIVTTSLVRASDTANIVAEHIQCDTITVDDRLLEYDMGVLTGTPNRTINSEELVSAQGAEDPDLFKQRVLDALNDYSQHGGNVLIVSHAGVGRIIETARQGLSPRTFYDIAAYPNAQPVTLDLKWLQNSPS